MQREQQIGFSSNEVSQRSISLMEKLLRERDQLKQTLEDYNTAIEALEKNPEFLVMINILGKVINRF